MNKRLAKRWIAALRSGKYKQCKENFRCRRRFCAVGVLMDIIDRQRWRPNELIGHGVFSWGKAKPGSEIFREVGEHIGVSPETLPYIAWLNDENKLSFWEIADFLEREIAKDDAKQGIS